MSRDAQAVLDTTPEHIPRYAAWLAEAAVGSVGDMYLAADASSIHPF